MSDWMDKSTTEKVDIIEEILCEYGVAFTRSLAERLVKFIDELMEADDGH